MSNMGEYWPKAGENLSDYVTNKRRATAVHTLEKCASEHPEVTLSLMKKLEQNRGG
jgi:hypothetical protein